MTDNGPDSVAFSPSGRLLAAANGTTSDVSMYSVGADGSLD